jgi:hypothetical protein
MKTLRSAEANGIVAPRKSHASSKTNPGVLSEMKARQSAKIRELGQALIDAGLRTLDAQADALGLPRSTAWTIVKTCHKTSGLSAGSIERMLASKLPPRARATIVEYVEEKSFGLYGGSRRQQQRFAVRLSNTIASSSGSEEMPRYLRRPLQRTELLLRSGISDGRNGCGARPYLDHCVRASWRMRTARASVSIDS